MGMQWVVFVPIISALRSIWGCSWKKKKEYKRCIWVTAWMVIRFVVNTKYNHLPWWVHARQSVTNCCVWVVYAPSPSNKSLTLTMCVCAFACAHVCVLCLNVLCVCMCVSACVWVQTRPGVEGVMFSSCPSLPWVIPLPRALGPWVLTDTSNIRFIKQTHTHRKQLEPNKKTNLLNNPV